MTLVVEETDRPVVRAKLADLEPVVLPSEILSCQGGVLVLRPRGHWVGAGSEFGLFSVGRRSTALPWTSSQETWHRFERVARD